MYEESLSVKFVRATDEMLETPRGPSRYIGRLEGDGGAPALLPAGLFLQSPFGNELMFCPVLRDDSYLTFSPGPFLDQAGDQNSDERIGVFASFANKGFLYPREELAGHERVLVFKLVSQGQKSYWVYEYTIIDYSRSVFSEISEFTDSELSRLRQRCETDLQFLSLWSWQPKSGSSALLLRTGDLDGKRDSDHWFASLMAYETASPSTNALLGRYTLER